MGQTGDELRFRTNLAIVAVAGLMLRIVRLAISKWNLALQLNDSIYYSLQARQLAHGIWFRDLFVDQPGAEHGPLTSTLMAFVSWGDDPTNRQRLVTVACGTATVVVVGLVARIVAGNRAGLIAAALAAVYPNLWINDGLVMSESVSCLMIALSLWALVSWVHAPGWRSAICVGLATGAATLARTELVLFVPAAVLIMWLSARRAESTTEPVPSHALRQAMVAAGVAIAVLLPWVTFNAVRFDRPVLLTTNDGTTLLGANCDETYYGPAQGGWSLFCVLNDPTTAPNEDPSSRAARQRHEALSYISQHAGRVPNIVVKRVARSLDLYALGNIVHGDVGEERERWASWASIVSFWLMVPLAVVGAIRTRRRDRTVLLIPVAIALLTTVLIYGGHRIRSAAEPSIVIFAAVALSSTRRRAAPP